MAEVLVIVRDTLFSYDINGNTFSVLHNFTDATGINPYGSLVQAQEWQTVWNDFIRRFAMVLVLFLALI